VGFGFRIPCSPGKIRDFAETGLLEMSFKLSVRLRRIEDLKQGSHRDVGPKDSFEMACRRFAGKEVNVQLRKRAGSLLNSSNI